MDGDEARPAAHTTPVPEHPVDNNYWPPIKQALEDGSWRWKDVNIECGICALPLVKDGSSEHMSETCMILPCGHIIGGDCWLEVVSGNLQLERWDEFANLYNEGWRSSVSPPTCPYCRCRLAFSCDAFVDNEAVIVNWAGISTCLHNPCYFPKTLEDVDKVPDMADRSIFDAPCSLCHLINLVDELGELAGESDVEIWVTTDGFDFMGQCTLEEDGYCSRIRTLGTIEHRDEAEQLNSMATEVETDFRINCDLIYGTETHYMQREQNYWDKSMHGLRPLMRAFICFRKKSGARDFPVKAMRLYPGHLSHSPQ